MELVGGSGTNRIQFIDEGYLCITECLAYASHTFYIELNLEEVSANLFIRTQGTCVEETLEQELKQNINKEETMEKDEEKKVC